MRIRYRNNKYAKNRAENIYQLAQTSLSFSSNGTRLHKFLDGSKPTDKYVINVKDMGPQASVKEFFTRVGVSHQLLSAVHRASSVCIFVSKE